MVRLGLDGGQQKHLQFLQDRTHVGHLGFQLLLYDTVVIPTKDFGIVHTLSEWCGLNGLRHLLDTNAIEFSWLRAHVAYGGNGSGLTRCYVEKPTTGWENWYQQARWDELESAVAAQIENRYSSLSKLAKQDLIDSIVARSIESQALDFKAETIADFRSNAGLNNSLYALERHPVDREINFNRLSNIKNAIRVPRDGMPQDGADLVLRVAEINDEIITAAKTDCHLNLPNGIDQLLSSKIERSIEGDRLAENFLEFLELERIPDVRPALATSELSMHDLLTIRSSRHAERFRRWILKVDADNRSDARAEYVRIIGNRNGRAWPVTTLRLGITSLAGAANPSLGLAAGAVDSIFVSRWLEGYSPRLFMDELRRLPMDGPH